MANAQSHDFDSTTRLETLSPIARRRAQVLRALAAELDLHDHTDRDGDARLVAVVELLLHSDDSELSGSDLAFLRRLDVQPALQLDAIRAVDAQGEAV